LASVRLWINLFGLRTANRGALGKGAARPDYLIVVTNFGHSWCLRGSRVSCCQVIFLARCILIRISMTPLDMGYGLIPMSKHSNRTSFMIHLAFVMDIDHDNYLYQMLFDSIWMLSTGCKPMMISTLIWLKLD
jgi:hypothetical protein